MVYTLKYSPVALETFDEISRQLADRWGDKYVADFKQRTVKLIETIKVSPFIYQAMESNLNMRKGFIHKNCSVFYEVGENTVEILFFWDNRQDPII
ncbi:type II toxin-antitoxin system RelE/ParE family toxin [Mucilaginibacter terrigena]|uniref:Type II toxin-antitoxin system RelE/ParE family toxin n=1 Tax=Mucilaginibacter terrigena TaxID=2492395 RepID=A0A4V1ZBX0_9SPHI|nr:type II toxin-antitoxin system RelE/ParE family toxin [Mucilaginibacter terrigena]RYU90630.1 type II toxin-antitoxin system RelE/ParE family toxin [Mucilaginibacter terrigena]